MFFGPEHRVSPPGSDTATRREGRRNSAAHVESDGAPTTTGEGAAMYETIIKEYFGGWEKKSWNTVAKRLADGFTFTSPAPDDHISIDEFKEKCWKQAEHIRRFE